MRRDEENPWKRELETPPDPASPLAEGPRALWNAVYAFPCQTAVCFGIGDDMNLSRKRPHAHVLFEGGEGGLSPTAAT